MLIVRAQQGDREAVSQLWDAYTPKIYGYLMNTLRDRPLSEDTLQTTWQKALEALPRFRARGVPFGAWLFAIARNECRRNWRTSAREVPLEPEHDRPRDDDGSRGDAIFIEQMLATLSEEDRELIRLRYIADLPIAEVARVLGITSIAARVRIHRTLKKLKQYVQQP